ncbi:thiol reductant ABC exporter subunit CydD [Pseudorhodoferax sp.]|uniref:thiol reductant ABC exporter subunit CydD n=1 Tax=Pseudorhodoferax sp. TaxID=1993553 RepID=UPI002DD66AB2|nr:thiol reductant ABC exporter subunit CydD [Pseudorhodoferax sp.]
MNRPAHLPSSTGHAGAALHVAAALLWLPQAALLAWAVQRLADGGGFAAVLAPASGLLMLGLLRAWCEAAALRRLFDAARGQLTQLRQRLAQALAQRSPLDGTRAASGLAASALAEQVDAVLPQLLRYAPARLRVACVPLAIVVAVAPLSWVAALVLVAAAPLIPLFMALVGWRAKAASEAQLAGLGDMHGFLLDRLRGLATLRALAAVEPTALRLRASAEQLRQRTMAVLRVAFLSSAVLELFSALGVAMVAVYVGFHLLGQLPFGAWGTRLSLGEGLFILLLAPAFFEPLRELSAAWHDRAAGAAALESVERLCAPGTPLLGAAQVAVPAASGAVTLQVEQLCFTHAGADRPVFEGLSFALAAGEQLAVVGTSGAGKSTLLALLAGLAPVQGGRIAVDGVPLAEATAAALRARMAWVAQAPHVFAGSVWHNVALGRADVPAPVADQALRQAALGGPDHPGMARAMGEGGAGLSGGELVRLALARASVHTQAGLVLADEPTAHLDRATADAVIDALLQLADGRTLVVATHDPVLAARLPRRLELGGAA